ncbi:MAG: hypothetical protein ACPK7O_04580 [Methanobacterium sp.]
MKNEIPVLYCKLKKYERKSKQKSKEGKEQVSRRYMIPVKKDQIEGTKFQYIEDIIILSKEDFDSELQNSMVMKLSIEKLKQSLNDREKQIKDLKENQKEIENSSFEDFKGELNSKFQSKIDLINYKYKKEIEVLNNKISQLNEIKEDYNNLKTQNEQLQREIKRITNLRTLENESFNIKRIEFELEQEEYDKLKKSHELLWDVVQEKDRLIKDLEKRSVVGNFLSKIKK